MTESSMQYPGNSNTRCRFIVGRNLDGCWVVCDRQRLVGGRFADRASAIHFAVSEPPRLTIPQSRESIRGIWRCSSAQWIVM